MHNYINEEYRPSTTDVIVEYKVDSPHPIADVGDFIASQPLGAYEAALDKKHLHPTVFHIEKPYVGVAYPLGLFEQNNISQIVSTISPTIPATIEDIDLPEKIVKNFSGPAFGIQQLRKMNMRGPMISFTPAFGISAKDFAQEAKDAWIGGSTLVKDNGHLTDHSFNRFKDRVIHTMSEKHNAESATGQKKFYVPQITAGTMEEMVKRAALVRESGGTHVMVNASVAGLSTVQSLAQLNLGLAIHCEGNLHGLSPAATAKLFRLVGADQIDVMREDVSLMEKKKKHLGEHPWSHIRPSLLSCSGDNTIRHLPEIIKSLGNNTIIDMGAGIHRHPSGTLKGSQAALQALEAIKKKKSLSSHGRSRKELHVALERF